MCVILSKPKDIKLPRETYEMCFENNGHGAGICYVKNKELVVKKGYDKFNELYEQEILPNQDLELLIHFRVASAGMVVDAKNCHPFKSKCTRDGLKFDFALVHNGTLEWRNTKDHSDTSCFNYDFMVPAMERDPWYFDQDINRYIFERGILNYKERLNKMVIMRYDSIDNESVTYILNKQKGVEALGCWFSNESYKPKPPKIEHRGHMDWRTELDAYLHRNVKGKWLSWNEWHPLIVAERDLMKLMGNCDEKIAYDKMSYLDQTDYIERKLGFLKKGETIPMKLEVVKSSKILIEKDAVSLSEKRQLFRGVPRNSAKMGWLDAEQKSKLRCIATEHALNVDGIDCSNWTLHEKMDWMRNDYRDFEQGCKGLTTASLDKYIIALADQNNDLYGPKEPDEINDSPAESAIVQMQAMAAEGGFVIPSENQYYY
jgi:hypothetical protein